MAHVCVSVYTCTLHSSTPARPTRSIGWDYLIDSLLEHFAGVLSGSLSPRRYRRGEWNLFVGPRWEFTTLNTALDDPYDNNGYHSN